MPLREFAETTTDDHRPPNLRLRLRQVIQGPGRCSSERVGEIVREVVCGEETGGGEEMTDNLLTRAQAIDRMRDGLPCETRDAA